MLLTRLYYGFTMPLSWTQPTARVQLYRAADPAAAGLYDAGSSRTQ